jgi:hypothetical protein
MRSKLRTTLVSAAAGVLLVGAAATGAFADSLSITPADATQAPGGSGTFVVGLVVDDNNTDPVNGCNANPQDPVTVSFTSSEPSVVPAPASVQLTGCDVASAATVSYLVSASAADGATATISASASGGRQNNAQVYGTFSPDSITIEVDVPAPANTAPTVTVNAAPAAEIEGNTLGGASVTWDVTASDAEDGPLAVSCVEGSAAVASGDTFGLGEHTVTCSATDEGGLSDSESFTFTVVDTTPPVVTVPANQSVTATGNSQAVVTWDSSDVSAYDIVDGSVTATCDYDSGSAFPVGTTTVTCTATDSEGNEGQSSFDITVSYDFDGFFRPVVNLSEGVNSVKAGSAVPIKFSLNGDQGLDVFASGFPKSLTVEEDDVTDWDTAETNELNLTLTAGSSSLQYDAFTDTYTYVWKTEKQWVGTERRLVIRFVDGTVRKLNFQFKK